MGSGTHFEVIEDGEMGAVENEDYARGAGPVRVRTLSGAGAVGTIGGVAGDRGAVSAGYQIEVYGTEGSVKWDFERMNELQIRDRARRRRTPVTSPSTGNPNMGDYSNFQPGPGNSDGL